MNQTVIFMFAIILLIGALLLTIICMGKKGSKRLNVEYYRVKCLEIEQKLRKEDVSSFSLSVLNADKLVDQALREIGAKGETMGERMKNSAQLFSDKNGIWQAHILRNKISHEIDFNITYELALKALVSFRRALKDLGAI